jgi:hypothetical protein
VGRPAFVLFVIAATLIAPGAALGLNWQRAALGELNEHRAELESSEHFRGLLPSACRNVKGRAVSASGAGKILVRTELYNSLGRSIADQKCSSPPADSWLSPIRC